MSFRKKPLVVMAALTAAVLLASGASARETPPACTPITAVPYTTPGPGRYCLTSTLTHTSTSVTAITVVKDVTIDFQGFTLQASDPKNNATAVAASNGGTLDIRNGTIRYFRSGIYQSAVADAFATVEDMNLIDIGALGMTIHRGRVARVNVVSDQYPAGSFRGISMSQGSIDDSYVEMYVGASLTAELMAIYCDYCRVQRNHVNLQTTNAVTGPNKSTGIRLATAGLATGNVVDHFYTGLLLGPSASFSNNVVNRAKIAYSGGTRLTGNAP
jgi:hypothetical protein